MRTRQGRNWLPGGQMMTARATSAGPKFYLGGKVVQTADPVPGMPSGATGVAGSDMTRGVPGWARRHPVLTGLGGGFVWGAVLRLWMRFIAERPEFTWSGTLAILAVSTLAGTILGVLWWRHLAGGSRWWRLLAVGVLPVFGGAGMVMLPSAALGGVGFGRTNWPRAARISLVAVAVLGQYALLGSEPDAVPDGRFLPALVWYTVMILIQMWAVSVLFRPRLPVADAESPELIRT